MPNFWVLLSSYLQKLHIAQYKLTTHMNLSSSYLSQGQFPGQYSAKLASSQGEKVLLKMKPGNYQVLQSKQDSLSKLAMSYAMKLYAQQSQSIRYTQQWETSTLRLLRSLWHIRTCQFVIGSSSLVYDSFRYKTQQIIQQSFTQRLSSKWLSLSLRILVYSCQEKILCEGVWQSCGRVHDIFK